MLPWGKSVPSLPQPRVEIWKSAAAASQWECCDRGPSAVAVMIPCFLNVFRKTKRTSRRAVYVRCGTLTKTHVTRCFLCEVLWLLLKSFAFNCSMLPRICKNDLSTKYGLENSVIYLLLYFCKAGDESQSIKCAGQALYKWVYPQLKLGDYFKGNCFFTYLPARQCGREGSLSLFLASGHATKGLLTLSHRQSQKKRLWLPPLRFELRTSRLWDWPAHWPLHWECGRLVLTVTFSDCSLWGRAFPVPLCHMVTETMSRSCSSAIICL